MPIDSNIDDIAGFITGLADGFSFVHSGAGMESVEKVVTGIQHRSEQFQCTGGGEAWPENSPEYLIDKANRYGTRLINYRTGQMLGQESLIGETVIEDKLVTMRYGTGRPPQSSVNGYMEPSDEEVTDIEKAEIALASGRAFYELDDAINEQVGAVVAEAYAEYLRGKVG